MAINKIFLPLTVALTSMGFSFLPSAPLRAQNVAFTCSVDANNIPITYARTPDGDIPVFQWTSKYFKAPYTPMRRCRDVSQRMNRFYARGELDYITSGKVNKLPVLCAGSECNSKGNNVLITLKPDQNANQVLAEIEANRSGAAGPSSQFGAGNTGSIDSSSSLRKNADGTVSLDVNELIRNNRSQAKIRNNIPGMIPGSNNTSSPPASNGRAW